MAWTLIEKHGKLNDEQIDVIALMVWPVEQAWRGRVGTTTHILPADLGLPRVLIIRAGGCGKTTIMLEVMSPLLQIYFGRVLRSASSN